MVSLWTSKNSWLAEDILESEENKREGESISVVTVRLLGRSAPFSLLLCWVKKKSTRVFYVDNKFSIYVVHKICDTKGWYEQQSRTVYSSTWELHLVTMNDWHLMTSFVEIIFTIVHLIDTFSSYCSEMGKEMINNSWKQFAE